MLIFLQFVHVQKHNCLCSLGTRFWRNVFEVVQNTHNTCFITSKNSRLRLKLLTFIKHCCSYFKHCIKPLLLLLNEQPSLEEHTRAIVRFLFKKALISKVKFPKPRKGVPCKNSYPLECKISVDTTQGTLLQNNYCWIYHDTFQGY